MNHRIDLKPDELRRAIADRRDRVEQTRGAMEIEQRMLNRLIMACDVFIGDGSICDVCGQYRKDVVDIDGSLQAHFHKERESNANPTVPPV